MSARAASATDYTVDNCTEACMVTTSHKEQHADENCAEVLQGEPEFGRACVPG